MKTAKQILNVKGREVWSIDPEAPVYRALEVMAAKNVGALVVIEEGRMVGILSERDYARKIILKGRSSRETLVREIMTSPVLTVAADRTVEGCMALMTNSRVRHLPVVEAGELVGILSIGDLVNAIIADQKALIERLEHHILVEGSIV